MLFYFVKKNDIKNKQIIIDEKQEFLNSQNESNEETDKKIQSYDRYLSKAKYIYEIYWFIYNNLILPI